MVPVVLVTVVGGVYLIKTAKHSVYLKVVCVWCLEPHQNQNLIFWGPNMQETHMEFTSQLQTVERSIDKTTLTNMGQTERDAWRVAVKFFNIVITLFELESLIWTTVFVFKINVHNR